MAKHECPDCGATHEMSAEGRIAKLEERVKELEAKQHVCPHPHWWYYPNYQWGTTTTWTPDQPVTVTYTSNAGELT